MRDALPNALVICFTGAPIEQDDANTRTVFGDYVSVCDIQQSIVDKATVPIDCESRIAKLSLNDSGIAEGGFRVRRDHSGEEEDHKQKLKTKRAALEVLGGREQRIRLTADWSLTILNWPTN